MLLSRAYRKMRSVLLGVTSKRKTMLNENKIRLTTITIVILSLLLVGLKYLGIWLEGFMGMFLVLSAGIAGLILLALLLVRVVTLFKTRNKKLIISFATGIIAIFIVVFSPVEQLIDKLKSPVVLSGYCEHTVTAVSLILRLDKSFEYNAGAFLSKEMYYGDYGISGDTLTLNFINKHPENINNKLEFITNGLVEIGDTTSHRHFFKLTLNKLKE